MGADKLVEIDAVLQLEKCIQGFKPEEVLPAAKELLAAIRDGAEVKTDDPDLTVYRDIAFS